MLLKRVHCRFPDGAAFLEGVRMREELASFRYTPERGIPPELDLGSLVSVVIELADTERTFHVHTRVIKRKPEGETRGVRFELLRDERARQELLLMAANGESIPYRRRAHERYRCAIAAVVRFEDQKLEAELGDISKGGCRIQLDTAPLLEVGSSMKIDLRIDEPLRVSASVVGRIPAGPARGICCEWSLRSRDQREAIDALVRALRD